MNTTMLAIQSNTTILIMLMTLVLFFLMTVAHTFRHRCQTPELGIKIGAPTDRPGNGWLLFHNVMPTVIYMQDMILLP